MTPAPINLAFSISISPILSEFPRKRKNTFGSFDSFTGKPPPRRHADASPGRVRKRDAFLISAARSAKTFSGAARRLPERGDLPPSAGEIPKKRGGLRRGFPRGESGRRPKIPRANRRHSARQLQNCRVPPQPPPEIFTQKKLPAARRSAGEFFLKPENALLRQRADLYISKFRGGRTVQTLQADFSFGGDFRLLVLGQPRWNFNPVGALLVVRPLGEVNF